MTTRTYCCFKGRGEISLAAYAAYLAKMAGLQPVGNAPALSVTVSEKTEDVPDYTSPAGGTHCHFREIEKVEIGLTLLCHTPDNLIRTLYGAGTSEGVASAAVVGEAHVLHAGAVVPLDHLVDDSIAVVVKSMDDETTYAQGTHYIVTPAGSIKHVAGSAIPVPTVTAGVGQSNIKVSYTRKLQTKIQLFSKPSEPVVLHFDGINVAADTPFATHFDLFKVRLSAAKGFALIGDNLGKLELTGTVMRDETRLLGTLANPFSQYGTLKL